MPKQKEDAIVFEGQAEEALKGGHFRIILDNQPKCRTSIGGTGSSRCSVNLH